MKILLIALAALASFGLRVIKPKKDEEIEGKLCAVEAGSSHKVTLPSHAIPFGDDEEVVIWTGKMEVEFSYQEEGQEKHHNMKLQRVVVRETRRLFLEGVDLDTGEDISFRRWFLATSIKPAGKNWQKDNEFLASLGIDVEQYDFWEPYAHAKFKWEKEQWESSLLTLWRSHQPVDIEVAYLTDADEDFRTVELSLIRQNAENGQLYLSGSYKISGEECTFEESTIANRIGYAGKVYSIEEFITNKLGAELAVA